MVLDNASFSAESSLPQDHCHLMMEVPCQHSEVRMQGRKGLDLIEILVCKKVPILRGSLEPVNVSLELTAAAVVELSRRLHPGTYWLGWTSHFHWLSRPCTWLGVGSQPSPCAYLTQACSAQ